MKINIDGNIIDTTMIYRIGEIEELRSNIGKYGFCIYFLNKNEHKISLCNWNTDTQARAETLERITNCRNKLIEIWKENQSCIPEIKL